MHFQFSLCMRASGPKKGAILIMHNVIIVETPLKCDAQSSIGVARSFSGLGVAFSRLRRLSGSNVVTPLLLDLSQLCVILLFLKLQ